MARTKVKARVRRTAEDARAAILDAAERRLGATGPGGIRLQEVAADVGVSHSTVLHHFGSREGLVEETGPSVPAAEAPAAPAAAPTPATTGQGG